MSKLYKTTLLAVLTVIVSLAPIGNVSADAFNQNRIIDDAIFDNANSMSATQIDAFLNSFPSSCISPNSGFRAIDPTGYNPTNGYLYGGFVTAGQVIYDSAQAYGINPQVLVTTLEKEQSLVTGQNNFSGYCNDGSQHKYAAAVGYGCPDSGTTYSWNGVNLYQRNGVTVTDTGTTCVNSASKAGFSQQVIRAAWLLKFGEQRSEGNINWAVIKGSWDNSDDPQSCYGGPMTQGTWQRCPSGGAAYYDGYTTIDATAVHMDDGATAALYWYTPHFHGNQNFFDIFTSWFGITILPAAIKSSTSSTVYLQTNGYKFAVPSMALLQDYGISPGSIQTVSQATIDSIPTPDGTTGLSTGLGYVVKSPSDQDADGGTAYLISLGTKYPIGSLQQFNDFGFGSIPITYLPLSYVYTVPTGQNLSNYIQVPDGTLFKVASAQKNLIFDFQTYQNLNPNGYFTPVSGNTASLVASGNPYANYPVFLKSTNSSTVYYYNNGNYYSFPSMNVFGCWGVGSNANSPLRTVTSIYLPTTINAVSNLGCLYNDGQSTSYLLNSSNKYSIPAQYSITTTALPANAAAYVNTLPFASGALKQAVRGTTQSTVWYIQNGARIAVPSMSNFTLLGLGAQLDILTDGAVNSLPVTTGVKLGTGQVVKTPDSSSVYVISGNSRLAIASPDDFNALHFDWNNIETYTSSTLDTGYLYNNVVLNRYFYNSPNTTTYLLDAKGCFTMSSSALTSYGQDQNTIQSNQSYQASTIPYVNFSNCKPISTYVKSANQSTVYWVDGGQRHPVSSWNKLVSLSGTSSPNIITLSDSTLSTLPVGTTL